MSARRRGIIIFAVLVFVAVVFCFLTPFVWLPGAGLGMALPVIEVPGEVVVEGGLFGTNLTNTFLATLFADFMVLVFAALAWRVSKGWTKEVPGRFQSLVETIVETLYNFCRNIAGDRLRSVKRPLPLWPLVATIFLFLLAANLSKLFPGVESVGTLHCAHVGLSGYPMKPGVTDTSYTLYVNNPLDAGTDQTEETEHACDEYFHGFMESYKTGFPVETAEEIEARVEEYETRIADLSAVVEGDLTDDAREELQAAEYYVEYAPARLASLENIEAAEQRIVSLDEEIEQLEALTEHKATEDDGHGEGTEANVETGGSVEGETETEAGSLTDEQTSGEATEQAAVTDEAEAAEETSEATESAEVVPADAVGTEEAIVPNDADSIDGATAEDAPNEENLAEAQEEAELEALAAPSTEAQIVALQDQRDVLVTELNLNRSQLRFPHATLALNNEEMDQGAVPYIFHITPFFRGAATDLSLTFALAILAIVMVQVYGVTALGLPYFEKFINVTALGNLNKKPMGAIDFVVGLIEIISEIGKIVSLAFRLFGNLFAGGVALLAISFLVSWIVPGVIYGLELIIGTVQALVFCVLTLVFSIQAMESHHSDEHSHDDHEIHDDLQAMRDDIQQQEAAQH
jgi:F0F1-type ATP synthase membrane subunit a